MIGSKVGGVVFLLDGQVPEGDEPFHDIEVDASEKSLPTHGAFRKRRAQTAEPPCPPKRGNRGNIRDFAHEFANRGLTQPVTRSPWC